MERFVGEMHNNARIGCPCGHEIYIPFGMTVQDCPACGNTYRVTLVVHTKVEIMQGDEWQVIFDD